MKDLDLQQNVKVALPKTARGYVIQVTEWEYIKSKISQISNKPNIYLLLASAFLGTFLSSLVYSLTGDFPKNPGGTLSNSHVISWACVILSGIISLLCFFFGRKVIQVEHVSTSYVLEQMDFIEAKFKKDDKDEKPTVIEAIFSDNFENDSGWQKYLEGNVSLSNEVPPRNGKYCLKKDNKNDPHGGFKIIGTKIGLGFIFSGWIYRPSNQPGGKGDRLAIEDSQFNGYGFAVAHGSNFVSIERRDQGLPTTISPKANFTPLSDVWYYFELHVGVDGKLAFYLSNNKGDRLISLSAVDSKYSEFDRITIHGGKPYYIDEIKIITMG